MTADMARAVTVGLLLAVAHVVGTWWILRGDPHRRRRRTWWFAGVLAAAGTLAALAYEFLALGWGPSFAMVCGLSATARDYLERRGVL